MSLKFLVEDIHEGLDYIVEEQNRQGEQKLYITGPFLMAEEKNSNGRIYRKDEMLSEVQRYTKEMISTRRALGELNHPQSTEVNPERACHVVVDLQEKGNYFYGKSEVLSTPMGRLVRSLIKDDIKMGISSRALGTVNESGGSKRVSDFRLICMDIVHQPSVQNAMLESVMESRAWTIQPDGTILELAQGSYKQLEENLANTPKHEKEAFLKEQILMFINKLKGL